MNELKYLTGYTRLSCLVIFVLTIIYTALEGIGRGFVICLASAVVCLVFYCVAFLAASLFLWVIDGFRKKV